MALPYSKKQPHVTSVAKYNPGIGITTVKLSSAYYPPHPHYRTRSYSRPVFQISNSLSEILVCHNDQRRLSNAQQHLAKQLSDSVYRQGDIAPLLSCRMPSENCSLWSRCRLESVSLPWNSASALAIALTVETRATDR